MKKKSIFELVAKITSRRIIFTPSTDLKSKLASYARPSIGFFNTFPMQKPSAAAAWASWSA